MDVGPKSEPVKARLLTTGQVARRLKVSLQTLHFYESEGLVVPGRSQGRRSYDDEAVARLAFIVEQRRLGLSLKRIAELLVTAPLLIVVGQAFG